MNEKRRECPISWDQNYTSPRPCREGRCGFWDHGSLKCCVLSICEGIWKIADHLHDIQKGGPPA